MSKVAIVIPSRYDSTRFPGKPLVDISGKTMIERVYRQCQKASNISEIWVATDNSLIYSEVTGFSGNVMLTSPTHRSGTERLVEASHKIDADIFVNVQGDEPFIPPEMINEVFSTLLSDERVVVGTLRSSFSSAEEILNPNKVKVVVDQNDFALYFSRSPIPYPRTDNTLELKTLFDNLSAEEIGSYCKHVGIYAYRKSFLSKFPTLPSSYLENLEKLEQLRILQSGFKIKIPFTSYQTFGIDVPEDINMIALDLL